MRMYAQESGVRNVGVCAHRTMSYGLWPRMPSGERKGQGLARRARPARTARTAQSQYVTVDGADTTRCAHPEYATCHVLTAEVADAPSAGSCLADGGCAVGQRRGAGTVAASVDTCARGAIARGDAAKLGEDCICLPVVAIGGSRDGCIAAEGCITWPACAVDPSDRH
jgi:hypothetical protein